MCAPAIELMDCLAGEGLAEGSVVELTYLPRLSERTPGLENGVCVCVCVCSPHVCCGEFVSKDGVTQDNGE